MASSWKEERVAANGITNGGENSTMGSCESIKWRRLFFATNRLLQKSPFPKLTLVLTLIGRFGLLMATLYKVEALRPQTNT